MKKLPIRQPKFDYLSSHKKSGIKVGDFVKVLRKATSQEAGWKNSWVEEYMDEKIGGSFEVRADNGIYGFELENGKKEMGYEFPYFVLLKL